MKNELFPSQVLWTVKALVPAVFGRRSRTERTVSVTGPATENEETSCCGF